MTRFEPANACQLSKFSAGLSKVSGDPLLWYELLNQDLSPVCLSLWGWIRWVQDLAVNSSRIVLVVINLGQKSKEPCIRT